MQQEKRTMKRALPYLFVTLIFATILNLSRASYSFINTHDEDDNIVSGFLMSRNNLQMSKEIFTHHLPGAYLISEVLDRTFQPTGTDQSVYVHRTFITIWNYVWAVVLVSVWGPFSVWLVLVVELLRASYLHGLFQAENLVIYPMVYLLLTFVTKRKTHPLLSGFSTGLIAVLLSPLWPLILSTSCRFLWFNRLKPKYIVLWLVAFLIPVVWTLVKIDVRGFATQFFGYNVQTYAPLLINNPVKYTLKVFLAPALVMKNLSLTTKNISIQLLVLFLFIFDFKRIKFRTLIIFGLLLGMIGYRSVPGLNNVLDFHALPWVAALGALCWYKYFGAIRQKGFLWNLVLLVPLFMFLMNPSDYFPNQKQAGKMVIRYADKSPVVNYLNSIKATGDTLFTLPAHTLLYQQTNIIPFNKFLFYLPWMEQSPILYTELVDSFQDRLPTFLFIDKIHFPYFPPDEISKLLKNYEEVKIVENEPPVYILNNYQFSITK
ncbi:MAG: hypothetical protein UW16_C0030G0015 [Microgenomates group bacterium GW2011_GWC1_44_10]|nr:MAG: hypothetical protein UW16_C0030G0015 [Microgenomates group bacterium GW2011_GWC1_44_10]